MDEAIKATQTFDEEEENKPQPNPLKRKTEEDGGCCGGGDDKAIPLIPLVVPIIPIKKIETEIEDDDEDSIPGTIFHRQEIKRPRVEPPVIAVTLGMEEINRCILRNVIRQGEYSSHNPLPPNIWKVDPVNAKKINEILTIGATLTPYSDLEDPFKKTIRYYVLHVYMIYRGSIAKKAETYDDIEEEGDNESDGVGVREMHFNYAVMVEKNLGIYFYKAADGFNENHLTYSDDEPEPVTRNFMVPQKSDQDFDSATVLTRILSNRLELFFKFQKKEGRLTKCFYSGIHFTPMEGGILKFKCQKSHMY